MNIAPKAFSVRLSDENTVIIANDNTTIGYATFDVAQGVLTYIFVHPAFRLKGFGKMLVQAAGEAAGRKLEPAAPVSPLGRKFFERIGDTLHVRG